MNANQQQFGALDLLTKQEIADRLRVSTRTVENLTARGVLPVVRLGGRLVRYSRSAVEARIAELTIKGR